MISKVVTPTQWWPPSKQRSLENKLFFFDCANFDLTCDGRLESMCISSLSLSSLCFKDYLLDTPYVSYTWKLNVRRQEMTPSLNSRSDLFAMWLECFPPSCWATESDTSSWTTHDTKIEETEVKTKITFTLSLPPSLSLFLRLQGVLIVFHSLCCFRVLDSLSLFQSKLCVSQSHAFFPQWVVRNVSFPFEI